MSPSRRGTFYFEELRSAVGRLPEGLIRLGQPASAGDLAKAEKGVGRALPAPLAELLRQFDGVELFQETVVVAGVGPGATKQLMDLNASRPEGVRADELVIAESADGDVFVLEPDEEDRGRVFRLKADDGERWLAGSSLSRWLDATIAHEELLYDSEGEFLLEAFEPDGEELTPKYALRRAERATRRDPGSAEHQHELGIAWRRQGKPARAAEAFETAARLDPENPWPWFDLGRAHLAAGASKLGAEAFRTAAQVTPGLPGARFLAWAARASFEAGDRAASQQDRSDALARDASLPAALSRAVEAAQAEEDSEAAAEAEALLQVFSETLPLRRRLPVLTAEAPPSGRKRR